uniref:Sulfotransfer_1 domain-containing protein n=1 Tax=Rhabditophanes sp. KR3021 TaxID=114890 RepID=A0AC35U6M5_9BILA
MRFRIVKSINTIVICLAFIGLLYVVKIFSKLIKFNESASYGNLSKDQRSRDYGYINITDSSSLPSFIQFDNKYRVAPKQRLLFCAIEKNLSTLFNALVCYLFDNSLFEMNNVSITNNAYENRLCKSKNEFTKMKAIEKKYITISDWHYVAIVRHPIERFISGFVDKCILETKRNHIKGKCYGCKSNVTCFIDKQLKRAFKYAKSRDGFTYEDVHFFPQNWHCEFHTNFKKYHFIKYEESAAFIEDLNIFLDNLTNISKDSKHTILSEIQSAKTSHSTSGNELRNHFSNQIYNNNKLLKQLVEAFYYDFVLFGFDFPLTY